MWLVLSVSPTTFGARLPPVGEDAVEDASAAGAHARAAQGYWFARLRGSVAVVGGSRSAGSRSAAAQQQSTAAAAAAAPATASRAPSSGWLQHSLSYWDEHEKAPSERGEVIPSAEPGAEGRGSSTLEVEERPPEPAPEL